MVILMTNKPFSSKTTVFEAVKDKKSFTSKKALPKIYSHDSCDFLHDCMSGKDENDGNGCTDCVHNFDEL